MKSQQRRAEHSAIDRFLRRVRRDGELIQSVPPQEGGSLEEIARRVGKEPRTLRSWMGAPYWLLPSAERSGRGVQYPAAFERRARLIARLLDHEGLGMAEVSRRLARSAREEITPFAKVARRPIDPSQDSAADYAARVRKANEESRESRGPDWNARGGSDAWQVAELSSRAEWETFFIQDGIEINVRTPIEKRVRKKLERILAEARRMLREP